MVKRVSVDASLAILLSGAALGQGGGALGASNVSADKLPQFDSVDIQVNKGESQSMAQFLPDGNIHFQAMPMRFMVLAAWGHEYQPERLAGAPDWLSTDTFNLTAKAPPDSNMAAQRLMLRAFLIKRFGLQAHVEDRVMPVYTLAKGTGGLKIKPSAAAGASGCERSNEDNVTIENCRNMTMDDLANGLRSMAPVYIDRPVLNLTEIKGAFDFELRWMPRAQLAAGSGMTVFESVDKTLGLKLEATEHATPVIVVDKVHRMDAVN